VRVRGCPILGLILVLLCSLPAAAAEPSAALPPDSLVMTAARSIVWNSGNTSIVELQGPVKIELDRARMSADNAVVWMTPDSNGQAQTVEIALLGKVELRQEGVIRFDRKLLVSPVQVTGSIRLIGERIAQQDDGSDIFAQAKDLRERQAAAARAASRPTSGPTSGPTTESTTGPATEPTTSPATEPTTEPTAAPTTMPATVPTTEPALPGLDQVVPIPDLNGGKTPTQLPERAKSKARSKPFSSGPTTSKAPPPAARVEYDFTSFKRATTADGNVAEVFTNGVTLRYFAATGDLLEFVAHDMVLFSDVKELKDARSEGKGAFQDHIVSAYFEGDVRVYMTPAAGTRNEIRMRAERVYYQFATDQAILTDVVFHTYDAQKNIPIFMRADKVRQMSIGEFKVDGVELSSSAFDTPTYGLYAGHAYVRAEDSGDPRLGERVTYNADNVILNAFGLPVFYFPSVGGTMTARGSAFRNIQIVNSSTFGDGVRTQWGLFEFLGLVPPKDVDTSFRVDYLSSRGVAGGLDGKYETSIIDDTTKQSLADVGDFHAYFVDDHGQDVLGAARANETPTDQLRGRAYFENQAYITPDVEAQVRLGYVSDSNFMAQWFPDEFNDGLPVDESFYLKYQKNSQVFTGLLEGQPNRAISVADEEQTNSEISRLPELGYYDAGSSVLDDHLTFFSENTASALKFVRNTQSLAEQGFYPGVQPGIPAYEYTGDPGQTIYRGDAREEIDYPINAGPFKVVPYAFGRYTGYSHGVAPPLKAPQSKSLPTDVDVTSTQNRLMAGAGLRMSTDFWRVDDSVESDLFDLHRLRHIVEPELNVFTSSSTVDQNRLFIYDQPIDAVNDVTAVQLALHQRWQTKRGGPGRWRSVDFFTLNLSGNFFANQPANQFRAPTDFRGYFDYSQPEASLARNSANADATWRISDSTAVLADVQQNLDKVKLATASVGIAIQRDARLSYFVGTRYIADLNSNIATLEINYMLDRKYSISATESLDLNQSKNEYYTVAITRAFDNFSMALHFYYDQSSNDKGVSFTFQPFGLTRTVGSDQVTAPQQ
jgi:hypothetical protein